MEETRPRLRGEISHFIEEFKKLPEDEQQQVAESLPCLIQKKFSKTTYTYLIKSMGLYKIGSTNNMKSRFASLCTDNPHDPEILCKSKMIAEEWLQGEMKEYHVKGEWYKLPEVKVLHIMALMEG